MLYPYRPSSTKNQQRWNFGTLYPAVFDEVRRGTERSVMQVECLLRTGVDSRLGICVRFLQLNGEANSGWEKADDRCWEITVSVRGPDQVSSFEFPGGLDASLQVSFQQYIDDVVKLRLELANNSEIESSADRERVLARSMLSAHVIVSADHGDFISLLDPPAECRDLVAGCRNDGCFPVLVGEEGERSMMLCSPIILYDYPKIAPESAGDFFDGTEMDEMLTLRVMTMTDDEKSEMRSADERTRELLERTEQTAREQLMRTHGIVRSMKPVSENE